MSIIHNNNKIKQTVFFLFRNYCHKYRLHQETLLARVSYRLTTVDTSGGWWQT